jgi:hypothetical protein
MKSYLFACLFLGFALNNAIAQYVPKDKRKTNPDTAQNKPQPKPTEPTKPNNTKPQREPLERKFVGYTMIFPTFLPGTITFNGFDASLNLGYRFHERFVAGIATSYGYESYNNVLLSNGGTFTGNFRTLGLGGFVQVNVTDNYFLWAEHSNLSFKLQSKNPVYTEKSWYQQPLFGGGAKYEFGSGNQGIATMLLFNPKYGDPLTPYRSPLVTRILYYFYF